MKILAIDLGSRKSVHGCSAGLGAEHETVYGSLDTTPEAFHDLLTQVAPEQVVIEIGGEAGWVFDLCSALDIPCDVANTADEIWRWKGSRKKTDKKDVDRMLFLAHADELPKVYMPTRDVRQWRNLIRFRHELVQDQTEIKNRLRSTLKREAISLQIDASAWSKAHVAAMAEHAKPLEDCSADEYWRGQLDIELVRLAQVAAHIKKITRKLNELAKADERIARLRTMLGFGPRTAEKFVATIDDPHRFAKGKLVGCYLGLTIRQFQSGQMMRDGKISRMGDAHLRSLLIEAAWAAVNKPGPMQDLFERVRRGMKERKKVAIVAVARHLAIIAWAMMRDGTEWQPELATSRAA